jgi:hypothetical protein
MLGGYLGKIIQWLRHQLPTHKKFLGLDPNNNQAAPERWTHLPNSFLERCSKFQTVNAGDYTFGVDERHPLYKDLGWGYEGDEDVDFEWDKIEHPLSHKDLKTIFISLTGIQLWSQL